MKWNDQGIVLALQPFDDTKQILTLLTREHGVHRGMVRGKRSVAASLQPGNLLRCSWQGRLETQLGSYTIELVHSVMPHLLQSHIKLLAVQTLTHFCYRFLPEREPHLALFDAFLAFLDGLSEPNWLAHYATLEHQSLYETGTIPDEQKIQHELLAQQIDPTRSTIDALAANGYVLQHYVAKALEQTVPASRHQLMHLAKHTQHA